MQVRLLERVVRTGPSDGVALGEVLGWHQRGSSQDREALSPAKPGQTFGSRAAASGEGH